MSIAGHSFAACKQTKTTYGLVSLCIVCSLCLIFPLNRKYDENSSRETIDLKKAWFCVINKDSHN